MTVVLDGVQRNDKEYIICLILIQHSGSILIEISVKAQSYLKELLSQQEDDDVGIRVFVADPGTPSAEACIAYCRPGEEEEGDVPVDYEGFRAWFESRSEPFLEDAEVDYQEDTMGGQ